MCPCQFSKTLSLIPAMPFQSVHNYPHEQTRRKTAGRCRADWYANAEAVCGYAYDSARHKIFDSQVTVTNQRDKFENHNNYDPLQGFCCYCDMARNNKVWRGQNVNCLDQRNTHLGHCLVFDDYR